MVWYGRVWDDAAGDWAHELDDVPERSRATRATITCAPPPRPPCIQRTDGNHDFTVVYSGRFRCRRCDFEIESTYQQIGMAFVSNGHVVLNRGNGLPCPTVSQ